MLDSECLDQAEACVRRATAVLPEAANELELAAAHLLRARTAGTVDPEALRRLDDLRQQMTVLQTLVRHGAALYIGLDQLDQTTVIGYTPTGLERAF